MSIENAHDLFVTDGDINDCGIARDVADRGALINPRAYFFQNPDGWIIFAIPCENDFTLIGTTDLDYHHNPVKSEDIVWSFSSVQPLFDDGASKAQEATRYYVVTLKNSPFLTDRPAEPGVSLWYDGSERSRHNSGFERPEASFRSSSLWRVGHWLPERERAQTADDILWRRTKQGLLLTNDEAQSLEVYLEGNGRSYQ